MLYLPPGQVYDYALKDAQGGPIWTRQGISAGLDSADIAAANGAGIVGFIQAGVGATSRTAQDKLRERVSVKDFGAVGDGATDDTAAIQAAITAQASATKAGSVYWPDGNYLVSATLVVPTGKGVTMQAMARSCARITKNTAGDILQAGSSKIDGIDFFHNGATGSCVVSAGDNLSLFGCGFVPGSSNTSPMVTLGHANHNVDGCVFVGSNAAQWCVDVVANAGNLCINGRIGNQTTMYGNSNGVRLRTGTGGRPEGWDIDAKIIVTGAASVEVLDCLSCQIGGVLDQASAYGVKLSPPTAGRIEGLHVVDAYIATATAPTTGTGVGASNTVTGGITGLLVSRNHIQLCGYGVVLDQTMVGARCSHNDIEQITTTNIKYNGAVAVSIDHNFLSGSNNLLSLVDGATGSQVSVVGNSLDTNGSVTYTPTNPSAFEFCANVGKKFSGFSSVTMGASSGTSGYAVVPHGLAVTPNIKKVTGGVAQGTGAHQNVGFRIASVDATNVTCEVFYSVVTAGTLQMNLFCSA